MTTTEYKDLLSLLTNSVALDPTANIHDALKHPDPYPHFVRSSLRLVTPSEDPSVSPIIIISAPGAVGKTTLARQLAAERNGWMWDLSRIKLGDNTFIGTTAQSFGIENLAQVLGHLKNGRLLFVFDAFDELELHSGWDAIEEFVREVWEAVSLAPCTVAVLLARSKTAEDLDAWLELLGDGSVRHSTYEINYFDEDSAYEFVGQELLARDITHHQQHPEPFRDALSRIFTVITNNFGVTQQEIWTVSSPIKSYRLHSSKVSKSRTAP